MEIFLVGGAVRDFLLARMQNKLQTPQAIESYWTHVEKDWVVVGAKPQDMLALGFRQVGKSFPVFLHPQTQEEYALARTERKTAKGYTGFECYAQPDVTLEEDLKRRDLTINAIAMRLASDHFFDFTLIDPYGGINDLKHKIFRHISIAFSEDPVRILRIARFASRFTDFQVAPTTLALMKEMVLSGEIDALVPERVWQEWYRSLKEDAPWRFFEILQACSAKEKLFPEISNEVLKKNALSLMVQNKLAESLRLAVELYDLSQQQLLNMISRYKLPHDYSDLSILVAKHYPLLLKSHWSAEEILKFFETTDALRRGQRFDYFLKTGEVLLEAEGKQVLIPPFKEILNQIKKIDNQQLLALGLQGEAFATELRKLRLKEIEKFGSF